MQKLKDDSIKENWLNAACREFDQGGAKLGHVIDGERSQDGNFASKGFFVNHAIVLRDEAFDLLEERVGKVETSSLFSILRSVGGNSKPARAPSP